MKIPREVREAVEKADLEKLYELATKGVPKCLNRLGRELSKNHDHDASGNCILKNWSNSEVHLRK